MARIRRHLTYANVIATLALFLAFGGGAYAAIKLPKNSVTSKQIKNDSITSPKVKDRSLLARDFKAGQLPAGPPGAAGATGPKGLKGDTGLQGDPGMSGYVQVNAFSAGDSSQEQNATAMCPQGTKVIGGGATINTGGSRVDLALATSIPLDGGGGWTATAVETTTHAGTWAVNARAICANVAP
jgi:hypothetical protein